MRAMDSPLGVRHYFAIGTIAATTLFCEIALTRLFSVVQYYHGAFLAISVALFGFAVSGVYVFLRSERLGRDRLDLALARYILLLAVSIPLCFGFYLYVGADALLGWLGAAEGPTLAGVALEYALLAVPFFASGVCISLLLLHGAARASRLYAVDLVASACGGVLVVPALALFGGPKSMLLASGLGAAAALPFRKARAAAPALLVVAVAGLALLPAPALNQLRLRKPPLAVASEPIRWNSFSMVGVGPEALTPFATREDGRLAAYRGRPIVIDNSVVTEMIAFDGDLSDVSFLRDDHTAAAHRLRPDSNVLIIGSGGGRDILVALANGQRHVRAVEVNPLVVEMADDVFGDFTGHVYSAPKVRKVVGDARSYIANSDERFGVILASLIDTWAASAAGAFALTENLLYTTDAFRDYHDHLEEDGILSISRWHPLETPRLLSTAFAAWRDAGAADPREHAVFLLTRPHPGYGGRISVLLMKKSPFTGAEIDQIRAFAASAGVQVALTPDSVSDPVVARSLQARTDGALGGPWADLDLAPASDERPFFFNMVKPSTQLARLFGSGVQRERVLGGFTVNLEATRMLVRLFGAVVGLLVLTVFVPLALRARAVRRPGWIATLGYFTCIGLGFIAIEIGLLQRLILLLGKPVYSLAVILSSILLVSGLGSLASGRLETGRLASRIPWVLGGAAALLGLYTWLLPVLSNALLGAPLPARLAAAVAIVALPAFPMGMALPSAIRRLERSDRRDLIPWVWGVNGAMSVMASVGAILLAIEFGYTAVFAAGTACYVGAALLFRRVAGPEPALR